mgnify:CR=1 FL=1
MNEKRYIDPVNRNIDIKPGQAFMIDTKGKVIIQEENKRSKNSINENNSFVAKKSEIRDENKNVINDYYDYVNKEEMEDDHEETEEVLGMEKPGRRRVGEGS